jgi:hypothetical protein
VKCCAWRWTSRLVIAPQAAAVAGATNRRSWLVARKSTQARRACVGSFSRDKDLPSGQRNQAADIRLKQIRSRDQ